MQDDVKRWENRRKMAWAAFKFAIIYIFGVLAFFWLAPSETVNAAKEIGTFSIAVLGFFTGVVMAYIGAATWQEGQK